MTNKLKVILAGYNVDIASLNNSDLPQTPETISAAYARISRADEGVTELRKSSREDVAEARDSNTKIVYGYGHGSVAEHAVFNFDVTGISRLALEDLESFRLASYTEKSQRYVKGADSMTPSEFKPEHAEKLHELDYDGHKIYDKMIESGVKKEDARFLFPLSTVGQLGMTVNARELEHMIISLQGSPLDEIKNLSNQLYKQAVDIAPSLFKMHPNNFRHNFSKRAKEAINKAMAAKPVNSLSSVMMFFGERSTLSYHPEPELNIAANVLFTYSKLNLAESYFIAQRILHPDNVPQGKEFFKEIMFDMGQYSTAPREFENSAFNFQFITSSSSFAQLKRHRTATLLKKPYDLNLGYTIPPKIIKKGFQEEFSGHIKKVESFVKELKKEYGPELSEYGMTNAHRRLSLFGVNARSLYNFSRLREDAHAQWEIRADANDALNLAKMVSPLTFMLSGGKHEFDNIKNKLYSIKK